MDPYGTDLLLTNDGDFAITPSGQLATIDGPLNCAQALVSALRVHRGELPLQPDYGNAIAPEVIGTKTNDPTLVVSKVNAELRLIFARDRRFLKAENIRAYSDPAYRVGTTIGVDLVLAGGDRLATTDLTAPTLDAFNTQPELADELDAEELTGLLIDDDDDLPELAEVLEGIAGDFHD